jgi:hypothetical protein
LARVDAPSAGADERGGSDRYDEATAQRFLFSIHSDMCQTTNRADTCTPKTHRIMR